MVDIYPPLDNGASTVGGIVLSSGLYSSPQHASRSTGGTGNGSAHLFPVVISEDATLDRIACEVTGAVADSTVRLGIYADSGGVPGALVVDAGTVDTSTTGLKAATIAAEVTPGRYWLLYVQQSGGSNVTVRTFSGIGLAPRSDPSGAAVYNGLFKTGVNDVLPDPLGATSNAAGYNVPAVWVRKA